MNRSAKAVMFVLAMALFGVARAGDPLAQERGTGFVTDVVGLDGAAQEALAGGARPLQLVVKRQDGAGASEQAYENVAAAVTELARTKGIALVGSGHALPAGAVKAEFDTWFYVEVQKLNPDLVHLGDYADFKLSGKPLPEAEASRGSGSVNVVRVAAGLFGFARGWLPASFSGSMIAHGVREGAGGSNNAGSKPLGDPERMAEGLQRAVTEVRAEMDGKVVTFQVHATRPAGSHTTVEALTEATWEQALLVLVGKAEQIAAARP